MSSSSIVGKCGLVCCDEFKAETAENFAGVVNLDFFPIYADEGLVIPPGGGLE